MTPELKHAVSKVYEPLSLSLSGFELEEESREYGACKFQLGTKKIICRNAKTTSKKVGQFVTFWKRTENGPIAPFEAHDIFDYYVINIKRGNILGQFVFPKKVLIEKGLVSTPKKKGKRGFRVYITSDSTTSKQAKRTQNWQQGFFYEINDSPNLDIAYKLYNAM